MDCIIQNIKKDGFISFTQNINLKIHKMEKTSFLRIAFIFLILSSVVSCDKEETINPVVGTWEYIESSAGLNITVILTFNSDMTGSLKRTDEENGISSSNTKNFIYSIKSNKITLLLDGKSVESPFSISVNKLTITDTDGEVLEFIRK